MSTVKRAHSSQTAPSAILLVPPATLKPFERNARLHGQRQIRKLATCIKRYGFLVPLLIDQERNIIAGHGRLLAATALGLATVPVIIIDHLSEAEIRAFRIADNRLAELSNWDDFLLAEELRVLTVDFGIDADLTGFEVGEIDLRIDSLEPAARPTIDPADALPLSGPAICRSGDLWLLGDHRLLCGDARDPEHYERLLSGSLAGAVFTDPPYNVRIEGHVSGLGRIHHAEFAMASGEMTAFEFTQFLERVMTLMARHSQSGALHYICMDWRHLFELMSAAKPVYAEHKNLCVWSKDNAGMGSLYRSQHELIAVFKHGAAAHRNNVELGRHGRNRTNLWQYPGANSFARANQKDGNPLLMHPTVKPVRLVADAILDCTARGEIVLDPFAGSGTTLIAAERTGRRGYVMEIEPGYCDTIVNRWQALTGAVAVHAESGQPYGVEPTGTSE